MFLGNLGLITGEDRCVDTFVPTAQGASVPSLGLSNKAVFESETASKVVEAERHVKDMYPDHYFTAESYSRPPTEEALAQNTLWPEMQKLYGHGYEIFSLASTGTDLKSTTVASACKASKAEHAEVILWQPEAQGWKIKQAFICIHRQSSYLLSSQHLQLHL
jgi:elongator complex protein 2